MPDAFPQIVLLRHGETQWNRVARYQGQQDSPLTLTGIGQIRAIARSLQPRLDGLGPYRVWSSPLPRTRQSVSIFCEELGLPYEDVRFDARLMERAYGRWEGLTRGEIAARHPEDKEAEAADRWNFAIPGGGESFAAVARRLRAWLRDLPAGEAAVVMAHGGCGRVLRGICSGAEPQAVFAYDEPQSTAILLADGAATPLHAESVLLARYGCRDAGRRVRI
ncbi:MAG: histidine phosphatase family protein [Rhodospirillaceae bacterium]